MQVTQFTVALESNPEWRQIDVSDSKYSAAAHQGESFAPLIPDMKLQLCLQAKLKWFD